MKKLIIGIVVMCLLSFILFFGFAKKDENYIESIVGNTNDSTYGISPFAGAKTWC